MAGAPKALAHHDRPRWQWLVVIALAPVGLISGAIGFYLYDLEHLGHGSWLTSFYHAAQAFVLHTPHLEESTNPALETGRWLAAAVFGITAISTLYHVFAAEWQLLRLRFTRDHVVVCGLGKLGTILAREFKSAGNRVVGIEASPTVAGVQEARNHGITVIIGNPCTTQVLARARVHHARRVLATLVEEESNVAITALTGRLIAEDTRNTTVTECWLSVTDPKLRLALQRGDVFASKEKRFSANVHDLDLFAVAARKVLQQHPLDHSPVSAGSQTRVHLVVVGFGEMGRALALQAARVGHFANCMDCGPVSRKLKVTLIDPQIEQRWARFAMDYPAYERICDVDRRPWGPEVPGLVDELAGLTLTPEGGDEVATLALCLDTTSRSGSGESGENPLAGDDSVNLWLALRLAPLLKTQGAQVLVQVRERRGFGALFGADAPTSRFEGNLHPFGAVEDICSIRSLVDREHDQLARAVHENYRRGLEDRRRRGEDSPFRPADVAWEDLDESMKDSNRQVADHIPVKLRAIGYHIEPVRTGVPGDIPMSEKQMKLLARMEHARWCAERWLDGWSQGPRDDDAKRHPDLLGWEELSASERMIDETHVSDITKVLQRVGKAAYRIGP